MGIPQYGSKTKNGMRVQIVAGRDPRDNLDRVGVEPRGFDALTVPDH